MASPVNFAPYLESLAESYRRQQELYTLTDLQVEIRIPKSSQPGAEEEEQKEKVERSPVLAGLRKYVQQGHVLLVGKPGSGKSTALQWLLWEEAERCLTAISENQATIPPIPVLLELRGLKGPVLKAIQEILEWWVDDLDERQIKAGLREKKFLVLLDGINELPTLTAWEEISAFRQLCAKANVPLIFSTRALEVGAGLGIKHKLEMCALTKPQMEEFIQNRLPGKAETLLRQLGGRLQELAETPLLLNILCRVFEKNDGQIPQSRGELFRQQFAQQYAELKRLPEVVGDSSGLLPELLQTLAFEMMQGDDPTKPTQFVLQLPKAKAADKLQEFLQSDREKATQYLQVLLKHHLLQQATDPNQIEFCHQLFQEYYAAESLLLRLPHLSDAQLKRDYLNLLKWTEPLTMIMSLLGDEAQAERVVQLALEVDPYLGATLTGATKVQFYSKLIQLLGAARTPEWLRNKLKHIAARRFHEGYLIQVFTNDKDENSQLMAIKALGGKTSKEAKATLFAALKHSNQDIRIIAALSLSERIEREDIHELFAFLFNNPHEQSPLPSSIAIKVIEEVLTRFDNRSLFPHLVLNAEAMEKLVKFIKTNKLAALRVYSKYQQTQNLGPDEILEEDGNYLEECNSPKTVLFVEDMYGNKNFYDDEEPEIYSPGTIEYFTEKLRSSDIFDLEDVLAEIQQSRDIRLIKPLIELCPRAWETKRSYIVEKLSKVLGNLRSPESLSCLLDGIERIVGQSDSTVRDDYHPQMLIALGKVGGREALEKLVSLLSHNDRDVRHDAVTALAYIQGEDITSAILPALEDPDEWVYLEASGILAELGNPKSLPDLYKAHLERDKDLWIELQSIQHRCQFYNYEIFQSRPAAEERPEQPQAVYQFPNATDVRIFEDVKEYHENPPKPEAPRTSP